jgi:predicted ATP-binding protein involved in virulence
MTRAKAYREMMALLLSPRDEEKFEWLIGCMLDNPDNGPFHRVVLAGEPGSGKTTLTQIARKVLFSPFAGHFAPRVGFISEDTRDPNIDDQMFLFVEAITDSIADESMIVIQTTGDRVPVNKHYVLMHEIDGEVEDIADRCIALYRELGDDYYQTFQENNR